MPTLHVNHIVSEIPGFANSEILTSVWFRGMHFLGYIAASLSERLTALRTTILLNVGNSVIAVGWAPLVPFASMKSANEQP